MLDPINSGAPASAKRLAALCDRVAISLNAGIDVRRVWRGEADRQTGRAAGVCAEVADAIEAGESLDQAIADAGPFFPPLMVELVRVGEQTGSTTEVFARLAKHYERQVARTRELRGEITWPVLQLAAALGIVAMLILVGGVLQDGRGKPLDLLGIGLAGSQGLFVYLSGLFGIALVLGMAWMIFLRQPRWGDWLRGRACSLPAIGPAVRKIALARIAWTLRLTMNVALDIRRVAKVVLRASGNRRYARHADTVSGRIEQGMPLTASFQQTGEFPSQFLDALGVAEETGMIVESMDRLSKQYDEEAEHAIGTLSTLLAFAIWAGVATLVILLIFRIYSFYTGAIQDALQGL